MKYLHACWVPDQEMRHSAAHVLSVHYSSFCALLNFSTWSPWQTSCRRHPKPESMCRCWTACGGVCAVQSEKGKALHARQKVRPAGHVAKPRESFLACVFVGSFLPCVEGTRSPKCNVKPQGIQQTRAERRAKRRQSCSSIFSCTFRAHGTRDSRARFS